MKNAIILAAGRSIASFAPFTYERPKGMFTVRGEVLIERQIRQLRAAGIEDIYIVVGYMKEKFFYLEEKFGVHLLVNNNFSKPGNLYSLYVAREYLADSFICYADQYYTENPFRRENGLNRSYHACAVLSGKFREFAVKVSDADVITEVTVGGSDSLAMVGYAYFNAAFSARIRTLMEREIADFRVDALFWEEYFGQHIRELTLYAEQYTAGEIIEFDSIEDLRQFDVDFLMNVDSRIVANICSVLGCHPNRVVDIEVIQAGLTNVSFAFTVDGVYYVYRHPGGTARNLINRDTEVVAQLAARTLGIDESVIYIDPAGWKLSRRVDSVPYKLLCGGGLTQLMGYLQRLHNYEVTAEVKDFDTYTEALHLIDLATATKGDLYTEFAELIAKVGRLDGYLKTEAKRLQMRRVLCHNDVYAPNMLIGADGAYLIDWEYAGLNDPANDIGCIIARGSYSDSEMEQILATYLGAADDAIYQHYRAYIPLTAFYWFAWGLYKGSVGDDDGFFFLPAYRACVRYIDSALAAYERK